jgi:metal-responsive CopG/Arc/MetJ family transcriptional regulator
MKRTTISLPDDLAVVLEREAQRQATSVSDIARRAISEYLGRSTPKRRVPFAGIGDSGERHTARDAEEILAAEWGHDRDR